MSAGNGAAHHRAASLKLAASPLKVVPWVAVNIGASGRHAGAGYANAEGSAASIEGASNGHLHIVGIFFRTGMSPIALPLVTVPLGVDP
jgi:hypothetical protein